MHRGFRDTDQVPGGLYSCINKNILVKIYYCVIITDIGIYIRKFGSYEAQVMKSIFNTRQGNKRAAIGLSVLLIIMVLFKITLIILSRNYIYLITADFCRHILNPAINVLILLLLIMLELILIPKVWLIVLTTIVGILALLLISSFGLIDRIDSKYFYFNSPDNSNTLIVEENTWLLAGWSDFYIKDNMFFVRKINAKILTDNGYRPFTNKDYILTWINNNTVELTYGFGGNGTVEKEIIRLP